MTSAPAMTLATVEGAAHADRRKAMTDFDIQQIIPATMTHPGVWSA
jgi:hypothetical protein